MRVISMKILQINSVYETGSTGKIVHDLHNVLLQQHYDSIVCYGREKKVSEPFVYKTCGEFYSKFNNLISRFSGMMYGGCFYSTKKLIHIIKKEKPDIVHIHCINGYFVNIYRLISFLRDNKYKVVLTLHAEFMYTANCGYSLDCDRWRRGCGQCPRLRKETKSLFFDKTASSWKKMKQAFDSFDENLIVTSVSPWLMQRAKKSPILADKKHCVVFNGIDTDNVFHVTKNNLRHKLCCEGKKVVLHVTASFTREIKGGKYVIDLAKRMKGIVFVVIGNTENLISKPENILDLGRIENQNELAAYYSMADLLLITSEKETFCMPVAESLCCGTPVVGFRAGAPEQIALKEYSRFVSYGDMDSLQRGVEEMLACCYNRDTIALEATKIYSKSVMMNGYKAVYQKLIG